MSLLVGQLLVCLGAAHVLGNSLVGWGREDNEKQTLRELGWNALIVAGLSYLFCGAWRAWAIPLCVAILHALVHGVVARVPLRGAAVFLVRHSLHLVVLTGIAIFVGRQEPGVFGVSLLNPLPQSRFFVFAN
jgi:hypothetical protein